MVLPYSSDGVKLLDAICRDGVILFCLLTNCIDGLRLLHVHVLTNCSYGVMLLHALTYRSNEWSTGSI